MRAYRFKLNVEGKPSAGALITSSLINFVTSLSRTTESSAQPLWALVSSCRMAVRKPWGLKKPVIQHTFGRPSNNQPLSWALRSSRSAYQKPSVADSQDIYSQLFIDTYDVSAARDILHCWGILAASFLRFLLWVWANRAGIFRPISYDILFLNPSPSKTSSHSTEAFMIFTHFIYYSAVSPIHGCPGTPYRDIISSYPVSCDMDKISVGLNDETWKRENGDWIMIMH